MCILGSPVLDNGIEAFSKGYLKSPKSRIEELRKKKKKNEIVVKEVLFVFNRIRT